MRLIDDFFKIETEEQLDEAVLYHISLNPEHVIYKAHFPGQPITPGVCVMKVAHELAERCLNTKLKMVAAKNVKFMAVISPLENRHVCMYIENPNSFQEQLVNLKIQVKDEDKVFAKLSLVFEPI